MYTKVKAFSQDDPYDLENEINYWLSTNRQYEVVQIAYTSIPSSGRFSERYFSALILVREKEHDSI